ncbi:MAG: Nif11-like leader peptide family RiPP precursor, partial [Peptococcaceae bacterium]|nr:Nif11-like leader peptide family RiPP precursor [Peptococcaceae bacterium]
WCENIKLLEEKDMITKEFIEKLNHDAKENNFAIVEKIQAAGKNPEAVYAIAQEAGVTDSFEVFQEEMKKAYNALNMELSDEELLAVAGGELSTGGAIAIGVSVGIVGDIVGAAIAAA